MAIPLSRVRGSTILLVVVSVREPFSKDNQSSPSILQGVYCMVHSMGVSGHPVLADDQVIIAP
jgi:hypothetical protein